MGDEAATPGGITDRPYVVTGPIHGVPDAQFAEVVHRSVAIGAVEQLPQLISADEQGIGEFACAQPVTHGSCLVGEVQIWQPIKSSRFKPVAGSSAAVHRLRRGAAQACRWAPRRNLRMP